MDLNQYNDSVNSDLWNYGGAIGNVANMPNMRWGGSGGFYMWIEHEANHLYYPTPMGYVEE